MMRKPVTGRDDMTEAEYIRLKNLTKIRIALDILSNIQTGDDLDVYGVSAANMTEIVITLNQVESRLAANVSADESP